MNEIPLPIENLQRFCENHFSGAVKRMHRILDFKQFPYQEVDWNYLPWECTRRVERRPLMLSSRFLRSKQFIMRAEMESAELMKISMENWYEVQTAPDFFRLLIIVPSGELWAKKSFLLRQIKLQKYPTSPETIILMTMKTGRYSFQRCFRCEWGRTSKSIR